MDLDITNEIMLEKGRNILNPYQSYPFDDLYYPARLPETLLSGHRALLSTKQVVEIPDTCIGLICLRSTWARHGLLSPPTIADPGFKGQLTMEVFNGSQRSIMIKDSEPLWSMHLLPVLPGSEPVYEGRYQNQEGIQLPKPFKSKEVSK